MSRLIEFTGCRDAFWIFSTRRNIGAARLASFISLRSPLPRTDIPFTFLSTKSIPLIERRDLGGGGETSLELLPPIVSLHFPFRHLQVDSFQSYLKVKRKNKIIIIGYVISSLRSELLFFADCENLSTFADAVKIFTICKKKKYTDD